MIFTLQRSKHYHSCPAYISVVKWPQAILANRILNIHLVYCVKRELQGFFFLGLEKIREIRESLTDDGGNGGRENGG